MNNANGTIKQFDKEEMYFCEKIPKANWIQSNLVKKTYKVYFASTNH